MLNIIITKHIMYKDVTRTCTHSAVLAHSHPNQPYHNKNITEPDTPLMKTRHNGTTLFLFLFSWIWGLSNPPDEKLNTYYCLQKFI